MQTIDIEKKRSVPEPTKMPHPVRGKYAIALAFVSVPVFALVIYYIFAERAGFADAIVNSFGLPARRFFGHISSAVPFSVMEALLAVFALWTFYYVVKTLVMLFRGPETLLKRLFILVIVALWIWAGFCYLWGADYYAESFAEKSGLTSGGSSSRDLAAVTAYFAENASAMSDSVPRGEDGSFDMPAESILDAFDSAYRGVITEFPFLWGPVNAPKSMVFSKIMSRTGFSGIFFPLTGETNINTDMPRALLPFTVAHELSHQLGVTAEQECNFLGIAACISSDNAVYRYSGWLAGLLYTSGALYSEDYEKWYELFMSYSEGVRKDFEDNNEYWARWESPITDAAETVYDGYLKSQGQELGIKSYGACVDLLIEYYLAAAD